MLNNFTSAIAALSNLVSSTTLAPPGGMWARLLMWFSSWIPSYGWMIIVFTIILKVVISPLDFYQRYKMRKNQAITERIKPELEKLEKQYKDDKRSYQQAQMALQKANGFSHFSACLPMILTMVIFFTLFAGMQNVTRFHEFSEYLQMHTVYQARFLELTGFEYFEPVSEGESSDEFNDYIRGWFDRDHETGWVERPYGEMSQTAQTAQAIFEEEDEDFSLVVQRYLTMHDHRDFLNYSIGTASPIFVVRIPEGDALQQHFRTGTHQIISGNYFVLASIDRELRRTENRAEGIDYWANRVRELIDENLTTRQEHQNGNMPFGLPNSFSDFADVMRHFEFFANFRQMQDSMRVFEGIASMAAAYRVMIAYGYGLRECYNGMLRYGDHGYEGELRDVYISGISFGEPIRTSFLWINSIWVPDTPWTSPVSDFETFRNRVTDRYLGGERPLMLDEYGEEYPMDASLHGRLGRVGYYNRITGLVRANDDLAGRNGLLMLAVLAIGFSVGSMFLTKRQQKKSGQVPGSMPGMGGGLGGAAGGGMMMKIMGFIMPLMIGVFALIQSSAFALYMIANSAMTLVINLLASLVVNRIFARRDGVSGGAAGGGATRRGVNSDGVIRHGRPDPTQFRK